MDEENLQLTIQKKLELLNKKLDEFEGKSGLGKIKELGECEVLETPIDDIRGWSTELLSEASLELAQYSYKLTRILNKKRSEKILLEGELRRYLGDKIPEGYGFFEEKKGRAIAADEYAYTIDRLLSVICASISRLEDLPSRISYFQKAIEGLRYAKKE